MIEQLLEFTNADGFFRDWAFFITGFNLETRSDRLILSLEAHEDSPDDIVNKRYWKVACNGFCAQRLRAGYLIPFYEMKVLSDHPVLLKCGSKTEFTIYGGPCKDIASLMGELYLVHKELSGHWVQFHRIFGFLPSLLAEQPKFRLSAPTKLMGHYTKIFQRYDIEHVIHPSEETQQELSVLLFSSTHYPDHYDYGQPYVVAKSFELLESK